MRTAAQHWSRHRVESRRRRQAVCGSAQRIEKLERLMRLRDRFKDLEKKLEDGAISPEEYEAEARKARAEADAGERQREQQEETEKYWNCDGEFSPDHQCYS